MTKEDLEFLSPARIGTVEGMPAYSAPALRRLCLSAGEDHLYVRRLVLSEGCHLLHRLPRVGLQGYIESKHLSEGPGWIRNALVGVLESSNHRYRLAYSGKLVMDCVLVNIQDSGEDEDYAQSYYEAVLEEMKSLEGVLENPPVIVTPLPGLGKTENTG